MLFAYDVCDRRGWAHPDHLLSVLDWRQFSDWIVYYQLKDGTYEPAINVPATLALIKRLKDNSGKTHDINA